MSAVFLSLSKVTSVCWSGHTLRRSARPSEQRRTWLCFLAMAVRHPRLLSSVLIIGETGTVVEDGAAVLIWLAGAALSY